MKTRIYISNKKYYLYGNYGNINKVKEIAKKKRKKNKAKYFIITQNKGYPIPQTRYLLYLNKK